MSAASTPLTGRAALREFIRHPSAWILAVSLAAALGARAVAGDWSLEDLAVVAGILALHPFFEWVVHVTILHFRPRRLGPWTLDFRVARNHRTHHATPDVVRHTLMPLPESLLGLLVVPLACYALTRQAGASLTGLVVTFSLGLAYEWIHFLIHAHYRPRSAWTRGIWRHHRLHHFKNEHYWMGVTTHIGDRVLGTRPDPATVPVSPTCRTLAGSAESMSA